LKKNTLNEIKNKLLKEKEQLLEQNENERISKEDTIDSIDFANAQQMQNVVSLMAFKNKKHIAKIDQALRKIDNQSFGSCEDCGIDIGEKRLKANPHALLCIDCQEEQETESRKFRRVG
jgi:DnaK suppressor protein